MPNFPYTWFSLNDGATGELNVAIGTADTSLDLKSGQGVRFPDSNFVVKCGSERIHVATRTTDTLGSLTRGYDGSVAAIHLINAAVYQSADRSLFQRLYDNIVGHTHNKADIPDFSHNHAQGDVTNLVTDLAGKSATSHTHTGVYEPANANLQAHVGSAHAPANAQKNSDITLGEIEAKLTGVISSHSHAGGGSDPFIFKGALAADAATGANTTPISLSGLSFTFLANSTYMIDIAGATRAAATTTGGGFHLDTSVAVTRQGMSHVNQLANTGTITGGSSIADDASVGVSSGRPSANVDTPVIGMGYLITGANGGTAQLRYRSETTAVSTVMAGLLMRVMKVT